MREILFNWRIVGLLATVSLLTTCKQKQVIDPQIEIIARTGAETVGEIIYVSYGKSSFSYTAAYEIDGKPYYLMSNITYGYDRGVVFKVDIDCLDYLGTRDGYTFYDTDKCIGNRYILMYLKESPPDAVLLFNKPVQ